MHPLLTRQLRKTFGSAPLPSGVDALAKAVDDAYVAFDDERQTIDRAMCLASEELMAANGKLRADLQHRLKTEDALRRSQERYALAMRGANDGIFDCDCSTHRVYLSDRWYEMLGLERPHGDDAMQTWLNRVHPEDEPGLLSAFDRMCAVNDPHVEFEHRLRHADGSWLWILMRACGVRDVNGCLRRMAGSLSDITARKRAEAEIRYAAFHDVLTGLPNRALLLDQLSIAMSRAATTTPRREFSILFMDMDRFKFVNDSLGHLVGDQLLVQLAARIRQTLAPTDTLARLGGDEFVVLLPNASTIAEAGSVAERIFLALKWPFEIDNNELFAAVSIGVAVSAPQYVDAHALLRDADTALYQAKSDSPGNCRVFDQTMRHEAVRSLQLDSELRRAIERHEFEMVYQPIVDLKSMRLTGFEALIRWQHPERGLVSPAEFIPIAEETGLMVPLGAWVINETCRQRAVWNKNFPEMRGATVAVNLSALQFAQPDLVEMVARALDGNALDPEQLTLEVTESAVMGNAEVISSTFNRLKAVGVNLSIDDFGTGYSSLACLHRFAFDHLKIDRSFVSRAGTSAEAFDIIETIVTLGHRLNLKVVAEGMETRAQLDCVIKAGCDRAQGYFVGRPLRVGAADELLRQPLFSLARADAIRAG